MARKVTGDLAKFVNLKVMESNIEAALVAADALNDDWVSDSDRYCLNHVLEAVKLGIEVLGERPRKDGA